MEVELARRAHGGALTVRAQSEMMCERIDSRCADCAPVTTNVRERTWGPGCGAREVRVRQSSHCALTEFVTKS